MSSNLDCCPSWLAYAGAISMLLILVLAGIWSVYMGKYFNNNIEEFHNKATEEQCLLIDYKTHQCSCGSGCNSWWQEYFVKTDKCPNDILSTQYFGEQECGHPNLPLQINETYTCYVLSCDKEFSFAKDLTIPYDPQILIVGGITLITCFGLLPLLCLAGYYGHKFGKMLCKDFNPYQKIRKWTGNDNEE